MGLTKNKTVQKIVFLIIFGSICGWFQEANAFIFLELFQSNTEIDSLEDADALIQGNNLESTTLGIYETINFSNAGYFPSNGYWGNSDGDVPFPGTAFGTNLDNFVVRINTEVTITNAGDWTFLTNSDDGVRLSINGSDVILDDQLHSDADRWGDINLSAGSHNLELVFFEHEGVASLELYAAQGTYPKYTSTSTYTPYNATDFQLIGDTLNGGIATVPFEFSPTGGIIMVLSLIGFNYLKRRLSNR